MVEVYKPSKEVFTEPPVFDKVNPFSAFFVSSKSTELKKKF